MRLTAGFREKPFAATAGRHSTLLEFPRPGSENEHSLLEYQVIFENAIVGICSMRNRIMLRCNQRFEEIFGYGSGELNNVSVRVLYPTQEAFDRIGKVYPSFSKHNRMCTSPSLSVRTAHSFGARCRDGCWIRANQQGVQSGSSKT